MKTRQLSIHPDGQERVPELIRVLELLQQLDLMGEGDSMSGTVIIRLQSGSLLMPGPGCSRNTSPVPDDFISINLSTGLEPELHYSGKLEPDETVKNRASLFSISEDWNAFIYVQSLPLAEYYLEMGGTTMEKPGVSDLSEMFKNATQDSDGITGGILVNDRKNGGITVFGTDLERATSILFDLLDEATELPDSFDEEE